MSTLDDCGTILRLTVVGLSGKGMGTAFVLMKTKAGRDREVYLALTQLPEVIEVHALYGEYDLLAMIEAESTKHLTSILIERFRLVEGVKTTQTLIAVDY